jgi:hypothetical protein
VFGTIIIKVLIIKINVVLFDKVFTYPCKTIRLSNMTINISIENIENNWENFINCLSELKDNEFALKFSKTFGEMPDNNCLESLIPDDMQSHALYLLHDSYDDNIFTNSINNIKRIKVILKSGYMVSNKLLTSCYISYNWDDDCDFSHNVRSELLETLFEFNFKITDPRLYFLVIFSNMLVKGFQQIKLKLVDDNTTISDECKKKYKYDKMCIYKYNRTSHTAPGVELKDPDIVFDQFNLNTIEQKKYYDLDKIVSSLQMGLLDTYFNP